MDSLSKGDHDRSSDTCFFCSIGAGIIGSLTFLSDGASSILSFACNFLVVFKILLAFFIVLAWPGQIQLKSSPFPTIFEYCWRLSYGIYYVRSIFCLFVEKRKAFVDNFDPFNSVREFYAARLLGVTEVLVPLLTNIVAKNILDEMLHLVSKGSASCLSCKTLKTDVSLFLQNMSCRVCVVDMPRHFSKTFWQDI